MGRNVELALCAFVVFVVADSCCAETAQWYGAAIIAPFVVAWAVSLGLSRRLLCLNGKSRKNWFSNYVDTDAVGSLFFALLVSAGALYSRLQEETWVHPIVLVALLCMHYTTARSTLVNWCFIGATTVSCALLSQSVGATKLVLVFSVANLAPPHGPVFSIFQRNAPRDACSKESSQTFFRYERRATIGFVTLFFGVFLCLTGETIIARLTESSLDWDGSAYRTVTIATLAMVVGLAQIILLLRTKNMHLIAPSLTTTASCVACAYADRDLYVLALYAAQATESFDIVALALWDTFFFVLVNVSQVGMLADKPEIWQQVVQVNVACLCMILVGLELTRQKLKGTDVSPFIHASLSPAGSLVHKDGMFNTITPTPKITASGIIVKDISNNASRSEDNASRQTSHSSTASRSSGGQSRISRGCISNGPSQGVEPWSHGREAGEEKGGTRTASTSSTNNGGPSGNTGGGPSSGNNEGNSGSTGGSLPVPARPRQRAHSMAHVQAPVVNILPVKGLRVTEEDEETDSPSDSKNKNDDDSPPIKFDRRPRARSICVEAMQQEERKKEAGESKGHGGLLDPLTTAQGRSRTPIQPDDLHEALAWNQVRKGSIFGAPIGIERFKELQEWSARNSPQVAASAAASVHGSRVGSMQASVVASIVASARASQFGSPQGSGSATPKQPPRQEPIEEEDEIQDDVVNDNTSRRSSVSVIEMNRSPLPGTGGSVPQQPGHVNTSLASSNYSSYACSMSASVNASVMSSVHQSRRSSALHQTRRGLKRGDTADMMNNFVGEGTIVGLDVMPEETTDSENSFDDMDISGNAKNGDSAPDMCGDIPMYPRATIAVSIPEGEQLPDDDDEVPDGHGVSVVSERRESGLDLNQLLSSCPNLSVKDMADKNSELGSMSLMELLDSIQKSAVFPVGMMPNAAPPAARKSVDYMTPVCRRPSVDTAQMQRNLYGLLPAHRKCNCTGNVHTCMSPMSSAGCSLAHSPHWGRSEAPTVAHSALASIAQSISQSERASVSCSPIHSDDEGEKEEAPPPPVVHTRPQIVLDMEKRKSLQSSKSFDLEKRAKKYKAKLAPKVKIPGSPIPEGDEDDYSRRPSFSQEPSCTEEGQPAVVSPTSNFARFKQVTHEECAALLRESNTIVLDVRGRDFCGGNIPGATNMRTRALQEHPRKLFDLLVDKKVDHIIFTCMYSVLRAISCAVALQQFMQSELKNPPTIAISILQEGFHGWINYWNERNRVEEMVENYDTEKWVSGSDSTKGGMVHVMDAVWSDKGHALLFNALQEIAADAERW